MIVESLTIDRELRRQVAAIRHADRGLAILEAKVKRREDLSAARLKPSGTGRSTRFEPYIMLGLHHARLDYDGGHGGDPLLVFQETAPGEMTGVALARHSEYATFPDQCWEWLRENRDAIDWTVSPDAEELHSRLDDDPPSYNGPGVAPGGHGIV